MPIFFRLTSVLVWTCQTKISHSRIQIFFTRKKKKTLFFSQCTGMELGIKLQEHEMAFHAVCLVCIQGKTSIFLYFDRKITLTHKPLVYLQKWITFTCVSISLHLLLRHESEGMSSKLTQFNQPFCWTNVFDWGEIEIPIFVNNCQLSVTGCTTLAKSNLHHFKLEPEKDNQIRTITPGETQLTYMYIELQPRKFHALN